MSTTEPGDTLDLTSARPQYDEYEDPEVEWLDEAPAHWETARFRFLLETSPSKTEVRDLPDTTEVSFVPMESVKENGGLDLGETKEIEEVIDGYTYFRDGDVLVAKITPCFENRKGALTSDLTNGIGFGTTELHVLRPGPDLDERFLYYVTMSHPFRKIGESTMYGAGGQKRVSNDFVENLRWAIPSPSEQDAIATFLDRETGRIDALIEKKERLIDLLEEKRTALISRVVTEGLDRDVEMQDSGVEWLGQIPAGWEVVKLNHVTNEITNGYVGATSDILRDDGVRYLQSTHIKDGDIVFDHDPYYVEKEWSEARAKSVLEKGWVLIVQTGDVGQCAAVTEEFVGANCHALIIAKPRSHLNGFWLSYFLRSEIGQALMLSTQTGATLKHLGCTEIKDMNILLPPLDEQQEIVEYLDEQETRIDALVEKVEEAIGRLKEYRAALISAAVIGQIDVREEFPAAPAE
jgi:type I restriction enzyme S subunit